MAIEAEVGVTHELGYDHVALRVKTLQFQNVEKAIRAAENQRRAMGEDGMPAVAMVALDSMVEQMQPIARQLQRELLSIISGGRAGVPLSLLGDWIHETRGLGGGLILLLGTMPPITEFRSVGGIWAYCGLSVNELGRAPKGERGKRLGFSPIRRAYAIMRVADPIMKSGGPYREVYDERKAHTRASHPSMYTVDGDLAFPDCLTCAGAVGETEALRATKNQTRERKAPAYDCSKKGGLHWSDGHRHADALRVTAKAVLRDAFRVARGQAPRYATAAEDTPFAAHASDAAVAVA